jgi:hypothetical protein
MIKLIILITKFIIAAIIALLFSSCINPLNWKEIKGSGNVVTETRNISQDFKSIEVNQGIEVLVEQSNSTSISVEVDDNLQKHIITKVENGVLIIESDETYFATETPVVMVKMPIIKRLSASGGSEIKSIGILLSDQIEVESDSGSQIMINIEADNIKLESSSGSHLEASGKALKLETFASSGSTIEAEELMANEIISEAASGSSTSVYPILILDAKASSGSNIDYYKNPKTLTKEENSGGSVGEE